MSFKTNSRGEFTLGVGASAGRGMGWGQPRHESLLQAFAHAPSAVTALPSAMARGYGGPWDTRHVRTGFTWKLGTHTPLLPAGIPPWQS